MSLTWEPGMTHALTSTRERLEDVSRILDRTKTVSPEKYVPVLVAIDRYCNSLIEQINKDFAAVSPGKVLSGTRKAAQVVSASKERVA